MLYWILRFTITPLARILFRTRIIGKENIPKKGAILAATHNDNSDPVFLSMTTFRRIYFLALHELFVPPNKIRFIVKTTGNIPIERFKGKSQEAIDKASALVKKGYLFGIFPAGAVKFGRYKHLHRANGYTGVARIALQSHAPVVPIAILNNGGVFPNREFLPKKFPTKVTIKIGKPLYFKKYYGQQNNRKITRLVTNAIMKEIRQLEH